MTHLIYDNSAKLLDLVAAIDNPSYLTRINTRKMEVGSDPAPSGDAARLFVPKIASDLDYERLLSTGHFWRVQPSTFGSATILSEGLPSAPTLIATALGGAIGAAGGDDFSTRRRLEGRPTGAANTLYGFNPVAAPIGALSPAYTAGSGLPVWGGFVFSTTFGFEAVPDQDVRIFTGIATLGTLNIATSLTEPSTTLTIPRIGVAKDSTDIGASKGLSLQHNVGDGATAVTKIDLPPANFPIFATGVHSGGLKSIYNLLEVNAPGSGTVAWMVRKVTGRTGFDGVSPTGIGESTYASGAVARGVITNNIAFSDATVGEFDIFYHYCATTAGTTAPRFMQFDTWGVRLP